MWVDLSFNPLIKLFHERWLHQEYDCDIESILQANGIQQQHHMAELIDELCSLVAEMPAKSHEERKILAAQIKRRR